MARRIWPRKTRRRRRDAWSSRTGTALPASRVAAAPSLTGPSPWPTLAAHRQPPVTLSDRGAGVLECASSAYARLPLACTHTHTHTHTHMSRLEFTIQSCTRDVCSERVEAFGGMGGSPFSCPVPHGQDFVALAGALGGHLHSISIYSMALPEVRAPAVLPFQGRPLCSWGMTAGARGRLVLQQRADAAQPSPPLSLPPLLSLTATRPRADLQIPKRSLLGCAPVLPARLSLISLLRCCLSLAPHAASL